MKFLILLATFLVAVLGRNGFIYPDLEAIEKSHPISADSELRKLQTLKPNVEFMERNERRNFVPKLLKETAKFYQAPLIEMLEEKGINYESIWINNCIYLRNIDDEELISFFQNHPLIRNFVFDEVVATIPENELDFPHQIPEHVIEKLQKSRVQKNEKNVEWNILKVNATEAWQITQGEGITIGIVDTGVRFTHETLHENYRGYISNGTYDHDFNWFDPKEFQNDPWWCSPGICSPWECCTDDPFDNIGHGTQCAGIAVGAEFKGIGVAPKANWIAAKGCRDGACLNYGLTTSAQWMLCPTSIDGEREDCTKSPDICSNSWGGGRGDNFLQDIVEAWELAGIIPVFSQGNSGPQCSTAGSPGDFVNVIGCASTDINDALSDFSSRGPGVDRVGFSTRKPDISAPGEDIYTASSTVGSTNNAAYSTKSGTSFSCPHVSGGIALILSVNPNLSYDQVLDILNESTDTDLSSPNNGRLGEDICGGVKYDEYPHNYHYGSGRLNVFRAVQLAQSRRS